jgi:hypothetical protein
MVKNGCRIIVMTLYAEFVEMSSDMHAVLVSERYLGSGSRGL